MNFFEHQEQARKSTRWLLLLFLMAVLAVIAITDFFILFVVSAMQAETYPSMQAVPASLHMLIAVSVFVVIGMASLYRLLSLRSGGRQIAEEMGARLVVRSTTDTDEKRLMNVVEEMAIASGFPVPQVYVIKDGALNAFAAGYTPHDAIIAVTTGTLESLKRDELQGVIAHEFSHILNGDMRLNLRLVGVLFGILFIGLAGRKIARIALESREGVKFIPIGLAMVVIGYGGSLFGNVIKATISRQREYLADASAVRFTRDPQGVSGALKKIGGSLFGSYFQHQNADEYSHFYFAAGLTAPFFGLLNTHPPLKDRIKRIDPSWDGMFVKPAIKKKEKPVATQKKKLDTSTAAVVTVATVMETVLATGMPTQQHVDYAKSLIKEVPEPLLNATRDPFSAYALVLGLLMDRQLLTSIPQQDKILAGVDNAIRRELRSLITSLMRLDIKYRLPLIELAISPLKSLSSQQLDAFNQHILAVINHDAHVDIWEWALHYWLIELSLNPPTLPKAKYKNFKQLKVESNILLSALAYSGSANQQQHQQAFAAAEQTLGITLTLLQEETVTSQLLVHAVEKLRDLTPLIKPKFIKALCLVAEKDGVIDVKEIELIRTISEGMGCPMPPILVSK